MKYKTLIILLHHWLHTQNQIYFFGRVLLFFPLTFGYWKPSKSLIFNFSKLLFRFLAKFRQQKKGGYELWSWTKETVDRSFKSANKLVWVGVEVEEQTWGSVAYITIGDAVWNTPSQPCTTSSKHPSSNSSAETSFRRSLAPGNCSRCFDFSVMSPNNNPFSHYPMSSKLLLFSFQTKEICENQRWKSSTTNHMGFEGSWKD